MQTRPPLLDTAGRPLQLGPQLGLGGEGAVFELRDRADLVVKLYHKSLEPEKAAKIAHMSKAASERLLKLTAWPTEPIRLGVGNGAVVGFTMPKITGHKQAFSLYSPKLRLKEFPRASWQFIIRSAANAARAFAVIHENGHVIGDVNHGNLFVGDRATVRLIDCDSYQITINGSRWFCEVGIPTHQPPELQNIKSYKGIVRTANHDNFGLAVIIFQMLFMARHPFSGRYLGSGEMPMERAISEYRFAYGSRAAAMQMQPPPASLGLNGVTRDAALLFERAFSRQGSQPNGRPTAREWVTALQDLEAHLKKCAVNPLHQFVDSLAKCPWCEIEAATGVPLFQVIFVGSAQTGFTLADFWGKVTSVANPGPPPALPRVEGRSVSLSPTALEIQQATWAVKLKSNLFAPIGEATRIRTLKKEILEKSVNSRTKWQNLQTNWSNYTSGTDFDDQLKSLHQLRSQYEALTQKRLQALQNLEANRQRLQLHAHLDACRISHARIKGIGDARKTILQSYGIETAADIADRRVLAVPGFGPAALNNLRNWRGQQERQFRYDPNKGVDPAARNAVERQMLTERFDLERKLNEGLSKLTVSSHHIITRRRNLLAQAEQAANDLAQAEADARATSVIAVRRSIPVTTTTTTPKGKRGIIWLGIIGIGGLILILNYSYSKHPSYPVPQPVRAPAPAPITPVPAPATPPPVTAPKLPPHVEVGSSGQWQPEDGYDWSDASHASVRWLQGKSSRKNSHVLASDTEGKWEPEDGYEWLFPNNPNNKSVRWIPNTTSRRYPNIVTGPIEGQWRPADGYIWIINPPRPDDMRVRPIGAVDNKNPPLPAVDPFQQGVADRATTEQWVAGLTGDFRRGVDWWAARRNVANPGSCTGAELASPEFVSGCEAARTRFAPIDVRRKSDPEYRRGWNIYNGAQSSPPAPEPPVPLVNKVAPNAAEADVDSSDRLNAQELQRLRRR